MTATYMRSMFRNIMHTSNDTRRKTALFQTEMATDDAFLAKMAMDFAQLAAKQAGPVYLDMGICFPVSMSSTMLYLNRVDDASLVEMARALDHPHQLVARRIKELLKLELIVGVQDPHDRRRTLYRLTDEGREQGARLEAYRRDAGPAFHDLSAELGVNLIGLLGEAIRLLHAVPLGERLKTSTGVVA